MKRTLLSLAILSCIGFAQAEYFIQFPVDVKFVKGDEQTTNPESPSEPIDCETQAEQYPEECKPTLAGWEKFATDNGLAYSTDWNSLAWASKGLSAIPTDAYPNSSPFNGLALQGNQLASIGGLQNITSVGTYLYLHSNALTDISGLSNLQTVGGSLYLNNNQLNNINSLSNLKYVGDSIYLYGNPLSDASGLMNAEVKSSIRINSNYSGPKLVGTSRFCSLNSGPRFASGYAQKTQLCEPGEDTWERFAFDKGLTYETNWNSLSWGSKSITTLPSEPYPNPSITGSMFLNTNSITNVDSLISLENVGTSSGHLYLNSNQLVNIDGLQNLKTIGGHFMLYGNQLSNLNALSNLTDVKGAIYAYSNPITDLSGLANVKVTSEIRLDQAYNGPKIPAEARFCTLNAATSFPAGYAEKYQVCTKGLDTWDMFALDRGFTYGANWNSVAWSSRSLTELPTELYPNTNPTGEVNFGFNSLKNVNSLSNISTVGVNLTLNSNQLTDISGLSNLISTGSHLYLNTNSLTNIDALNKLTSVGGHLMLYGNKLSNLNGLSNLQTVKGVIYAYGNELTDATGLLNVQVSSDIRLDNTYTGPKIAADSRFCSLNPATKFYTGYAQKTQLCESGPDTWENFAFDKGLTYASGWNSIAWQSKGLTVLPTELYPNANPTSYIYLNSNQLKNVDGLASLTTVAGVLNLYTNQLDNISGLRNLTSVGGLSIYSNKLTNVDGLSKLTTVNGNLLAYSNLLTNVNGLSNVTEVKGALYLHDNQITDITGISNMTVTSTIMIDKTYNGPKMLADSRFCSLNSATRFSGSHAQKTQVCEAGADTWENFAFDKGLTYASGWNSISWQSKGLTVVPTELYPNANPTSYINLYSNQLKNVDGLASLTTVAGILNLYTNQLDNISGLSSLTSVGGLSIYSNKLTNLDALSKLTTVNGHLLAYSNLLTNVNGLSNVTEVKGSLYLHNNQITDITGISNMNVTSTIMIDSTYSGPKMAADSRFCSLNSATKFSSSHAQKTQVCEAGVVTWDSFALDKGLAYGPNWNYINWASKALTSVPAELYPNANPTSYIYLNSNQLTNVDGLASLITVAGDLNLYTNQLDNVSGLSNLTSVGGLNMYSNKLTNLDGLSKLTTVNVNLLAYSNLLTNVNGLSNVTEVKGALYLHNNQITDITGLSNMAVASSIRIDSTYAGPKMLATSRFCQLNASTKFATGYAQKTQVCEI